MHAIATVLTKNCNRIHYIMDRFCNDGTWDYASIGGRYHGFIPVSENVKVKLRSDYMGRTNVDDEFPFEHNEIPRKERTKYLSCARFRNIDMDEVQRMSHVLGYSVFNPEAFIIDDEDDGILTYPGRAGFEVIHQYLDRPNRNFWYVIVVDYHF